MYETRKGLNLQSQLAMPNTRIQAFPDDDGVLTCFTCHAATTEQCYKTGKISHISRLRKQQFYVK